MAEQKPTAELDQRFSSDDASPTPWAQARRILEHSQVYWLSTVGLDGRPHVTTVAAVWLDEALYFSTGPSERKARNLARNLQCVMTTGCNVMEGLDVVVEGTAVRVGDEVTLRRLAAAYAVKYDGLFGFTVDNGRFQGEGSDDVLVFELAPTKAFAFGKGTTFSQTRWRFRPSPAAVR